MDGGLIGGGVFRDVGAIGVDFGEWWRIVTSGFLHAGLLHLGFNMFLLWMLGQHLEPALGSVRFGLLYGVSLLAGSFGVLLVAPGDLTVGASGAVFGLMGALMVAQWSQGRNPFDGGIGPLVAMNLVFTFAIPRVSVGGHIGGLIGGMVVGWLLFDLPRRVKLPAVVPALATVGLGVLLWVGSLQAASGWM